MRAVVCQWSDGWELLRVRPPDPYCVAASGRAAFVLVDQDGVDQAVVKLVDAGGERFPDMDLSLYSSDDEGEDLDSAVESDESDEPAPAAVERLCWFFWMLTPDRIKLEPVSIFVTQDLNFPREVIPGLVGLEALEQVALEQHYKRLRGEGHNRALFQEVARIVGAPALTDEDQPSVRFDLYVGGPEFMLDHHEARLNDDGDVVTWSVVDDCDEQTFGSGRTPLEAMRTIPFLVWPGRWEEWAARHLLPGEVVEDPEVYLLLDTWPPCLQGDSVFWEDR